MLDCEFLFSGCFFSSFSFYLVILRVFNFSCLHIVCVCETQSTAAESIPDVTTMQRAPTGVSSACPAALDYEMQGRPSLEETPCSEVPASDVSVAATSTVDIASESLLSSSSTSTHSVPTNLSSFNRTAKVTGILDL